jgi:ribonuclease BN (tRNA processing enzyme)
MAAYAIHAVRATAATLADVQSVSYERECSVSQLSVTFTGSGSPRPSLDRANPGQILRFGDALALIDCGGGTTRRILETGNDITKIEHLFLTHLHSDHTLDYAEFMLGSWAVGRTRMRVFGPPGTARLHDLLLIQPYQADIEYRLSLGRSPSGLLDVEINESGPGVIYDEGGLTVRAVEVIHSAYTLALRFDYAGESIVHSGDTCYCDALVELAQDADVLIHDACMSPAAVFQNNSAWPNLYEHLKEHHATPEEAGKTAREAGVRKLVLTHFLIGTDTEETVKRCRSEFDGEVIIAEDLLTVDCG